MNQTASRSLRSRLSSVLAASVVLTATAIGGAPAANAAPTSGDPLATGCSTSASTIYMRNYLGYGKVEVRYSSSCQTNWVRITNAGGRQAEAGIYSASSGWKYSPSYASAPNEFWTPMVYAPGTTCITFYAKIAKNPVDVLNTGNVTLC
ncbi:DUF2690 domain-containing protein [Rathayibacter sp. VKM Ac-2762]|uniref:DUF2690 domain-containing protein n=1 Tax=Rathayibacter sp. VKM Ac-2762 TaxID=2609254 RepID=UPI00132EF9BB|nr:DUF2690 domain-containing protein [Rathayibacter sp. VKM Ac-2762]QHF21699.1 DUF2690 domain-containing protein [Rathayibacter sp. VKM Ac-2762]